MSNSQCEAPHQSTTTRELLETYRSKTSADGTQVCALARAPLSWNLTEGGESLAVDSSSEGGVLRYKTFLHKKHYLRWQDEREKWQRHRQPRN